MLAKPKLGQNFLNDPQAIERIAASLGDLTGRTVIEIGPGRGAITGALAARAKHVVAVEVDPEMVTHLRAELPAEQVTVIPQDVLHFDFEQARRDFAPNGERLPVVGNLPYGITSQILLKLAANHAHLDRAILMVQREVADRVTAQPESRDYGLLSVTVQMVGPTQNLFTLPPSAFTPPPDVHSTVFRWRFAPRFDELGVPEADFSRFIRKAFAQKRKTLANNLRAAGFPPESVAAALEYAQIPAQARAEALSIESLAALWHGFQPSIAATPQGLQ
jgi:16S rRNA (adenine1518-N6/adenine1519-N6)-dimethyltransferase